MLAALASARASEPPPGEGNNDILLGRRKLSEASDLAIASPTLTCTGTACLEANNLRLQMTVFPFYTDRNFISSRQPTLYVGDQTNISKDNYYPLPQQTRGARLFDLPYDELITVGRDAASDSLAIYSGNQIIWKSAPGISHLEYNNLQMAVADVTGDGYDDLIVMNNRYTRVLTAVNVKKPDEGLRLAAAAHTAAGPLSQPVVADFGGDGVPVVAWVMGPPGGSMSLEQVNTAPRQLDFPTGIQKVHFATICIQDINGGNHSSYCSTQPKDSITFLRSYIELGSTGGPGHCVGTSALAAGRFFTPPNFTPGQSTARQLLLAYTRTTKANGDRLKRECAVELSDYSFGANPELDPKKEDEVPRAFTRRDNVILYAVSDRLNWWGNQEQAVVAVSGRALSGTAVFNNVSRVQVVSFRSSGKMDTAGSDLFGRKDEYIAGLATGRFNDDNSNADNYNPRIAVLATNYVNPYDPNGRSSDTRPRIFFLHPQDPTNGLWTPIIDATRYAVNTPYYRYPAHVFGFFLGNNLLQAGDFQGRSVLLGDPTIGRITSYIQPSVIAGIPPMMVDLVPWPDPVTGTPAVVNFSAVPATFWSKFDTSSSNTAQSSTQSTTGSTSANSQNGGITVGTSFLGADLKASYNYSREYTQANTVSENYDTYASSKFSVSFKTNRNDVVWYSKSNLNLFYYPIIGVSSCPEDKPDCPANEELPAYVEYAGPSNNSNGYDADFTSWYQPVQEPFQLFSYPRDEHQLELGLGAVGLQPLTDAATFTTGNSITGLQEAGWANEGASTSSVGTTTEIKQSHTLSVSAGPVEGSFSWAGSTSNKSVALQTTKLGESRGISLNLPGTFRTQTKQYGYFFEPRVFGELPQPNEDPNNVSGVDIKTHGFLLGAFTADAARDAAGSYWKSSPYNQPGRIDIAINHPDRWDFGIREYPDGGAPPECLRVAGSEYQCAYEWPPETVDLWGSHYYHMRGLLITQDFPSASQVTQTTEGKRIYLSARIYNYSFQAMPAGSTLRVRFYRQLWDPSANAPAGDAVLLNSEIATDANGRPLQVPPYGVEAPNWVIARTSFSTAGLAGPHGRYYVFWVVAWAEDKNYKLIPEVVDHGLSRIPGYLRDISDVPLQWINVTYPSSAANSGITSFTNNVGFFRQMFYVAPATSSARRAAPGPESGHPRLKIQNPTVAPIVGQSGSFAVSVDVVALKAPATGVVATAVDLTTAGARPFDMELIPNVEANHGDRAEFVYTPETCGPKHLEIEVRSSRPGSVTKRVNFEVPCAKGKRGGRKP